jgi:hypothetical protein
VRSKGVYAFAETENIANYKTQLRAKTSVLSDIIQVLKRVFFKLKNTPASSSAYSALSQYSKWIWCVLGFTGDFTQEIFVNCVLKTKHEQILYNEYLRLENTRVMDVAI